VVNASPANSRCNRPAVSAATHVACPNVNILPVTRVTGEARVDLLRCNRASKVMAHAAFGDEHACGADLEVGQD
jgi:hypothetical protein